MGLDFLLALTEQMMVKVCKLYLFGQGSRHRLQEFWIIDITGYDDLYLNKDDDVRKLLAAVCCVVAASSVQAAPEIRIAVAANLLPLMEDAVADYQKETGNKVVISGGSSGVFFEQIQRGAPFDIFFSADAERPDRLAAADKGTDSATYACGQLAFWTPAAKPDVLSIPAGKIAVAQPDTAPYGKAAMQVLENTQQLPALQARVVYGQDIGQTYQFVLTQNAPSGFVALSQLTSANVPAMQYQIVDAALYQPLVQKRITLAKGERLAAANAFIAWFSQQNARLTQAGYALPGSDGCAR